ncbi:MAG: sulfotransferase domain-containing protein [Hyphomicrobiaceae bacterium]
MGGQASAPEAGRSLAIGDPAIIDAFASDPDNTTMVSFPRTGSHWLRMMVELYFERPTLTRNFYWPDRRDFILLGTHDLDLDVERQVVLYLYRDPVETIYSLIRYYQDDPADPAQVARWLPLYVDHLGKWLVDERFTRRKTIVRYDRLRSDPFGEFAKVIRHFGGDVDRGRIEQVVAQVTKDAVRAKVGADDPQVIPVASDYPALRSRFDEQFGAQIWTTLRADRRYLDRFFRDGASP